MRQTVYEARLSLQQMAAGREMDCRAVMKTLSDADGRITRRRDIRAHLRTCADCRRFRDELDDREQNFAALAPLPAAAATGLLHGILGGSGASGSGLAGALGGGAGKAFGTSALAKSAVTVAVVAAVGVTAADRSDLIDVVPSGNSQPAHVRPPSEDAAGAAGRTPSTGGRTGDASGAGRAVRARGEVGRSQSPTGTSPAGETPPAPAGKGGAGAAAAPSSPSPAPARGRGRGHEKDLPGAAAHGQQTAAAHKADNQGKKEATHGPPAAKPAKPQHPMHPASPASQKNDQAAPPASHGSEHDAAPDSSAPPPGPPAEGHAPLHAKGQKNP